MIAPNDLRWPPLIRYYGRPHIRRILPTGGPTLPAYTITIRGVGFGGMDGTSMPYVPLCRIGQVMTADDR